MKKTILLMLALALLCTVLCACSEGGNVNDNEGGFVTDRGNDSNIGDDIKDGADLHFVMSGKPARKAFAE